MSDFAVLIAILLACGLDVFFGLDTPKLNVPSELKTTRDDRSWLADPLALDPWYLILLAVLPALLATILIFLDQQITAVIVNRKENKLKVKYNEIWQLRTDKELKNTVFYIKVSFIGRLIHSDS